MWFGFGRDGKFSKWFIIYLVGKKTKTSWVKMRLQPYERVIYDKNPLIEVICQVRFPMVLRISNQDPFEFQEKIISDYPLCQKSTSLPIPTVIAQLIEQKRSFLSTNYIFQSENSKWQVSLNEDSLSLATVEYTKYEEFREKFCFLLKSFEDVYNIPFYLRVGLRYKDLILRSKLNLKDKPWSELIDEYLVSELNNSELSESIELINKSLEIKTDSLGKLKFNHGIVIAVDQSQPTTEEKGYLLDYDFYMEGKVNKHDVLNRLDQFKQEAGTRFRSSITEQLHKAMQPRPL
ncbi:MAG: TIGR04255 family protein [Gomphosphaeria aponina SAG 52.96 = DSM 107014]|uniref:TIGR04255 family protein n=1 Tax=Gomphosphaeria aponina SAG 52.96 = DSM 107014 TaxID=1521640 RepID=A0A941GYC7_9CHRO|nr:TIGR04255 family protein [Gomphosphaeria aponina SAG 52.96 = DSM 107014]